jgi:hypothetical protein
VGSLYENLQLRPEGEKQTGAALQSGRAAAIGHPIVLLENLHVL